MITKTLNLSIYVSIYLMVDKWLASSHLTELHTEWQYPLESSLIFIIQLVATGDVWIID